MTLFTRYVWLATGDLVKFILIILLNVESEIIGWTFYTLGQMCYAVVSVKYKIQSHKHLTVVRFGFFCVDLLSVFLEIHVHHTECSKEFFKCNKPLTEWLPWLRFYLIIISFKSGSIRSLMRQIQQFHQTNVQLSVNKDYHPTQTVLMLYIWRIYFCPISFYVLLSTDIKAVNVQYVVRLCLVNYEGKCVCTKVKKVTQYHEGKDRVVSCCSGVVPCDYTESPWEEIA